MLKTGTWLRGMLVTMAALLSLPAQARAHSFVIDQVNEGGSGAWYNISTMGSAGPSHVTMQEFVPTAASLDCVELLLKLAYLPGTISTTDRSTVAMVEILDGTPSGAVLGRSQMVPAALLASLPYSSPRIAHFDFYPSVPLTPGVIQLLKITCFSGFNDPPTLEVFLGDSYPSGIAWLDMWGNTGSHITSKPSDDLWFREGPAAPTPTHASTWGRLKSLYR